MLAPTGKVFYQDSYKITYEFSWFTHEDCQNVEYLSIVSDPNIPGTMGEVTVDGNSLFKYGQVNTERKLLKLDGIAGYFTQSNLSQFITRSNDPLNASVLVGRRIQVRNKTTDGFRTFKAIIASISSDNVITLASDPEESYLAGDGPAFIQLSSGYEVIADGGTHALGLVQLYYPYSNRPEDNFRVHCDNEYTEEIHSYVTDGSGFADNAENYSILTNVQSDGSTTTPDGFGCFADGLTVGFWANPNSSTNNASFFDIGGGIAADNIILGRVGTTSNLSLKVYQGATPTTITASSAIIDGEWHYYAATIDSSGEGRIYRDGVMLTSGAVGIPPVTSRVSNFIGQSNDPADSFYDGALNDFSVWSVALSGSQLTQIKDKALAGAEVGLLLLYNLNSATIIDGTANNRDGSVNGSLTVISAQESPISSALVFDGVSSISIPSSQNAKIARFITIWGE